ncbi:flagellin, partial [Gammaproteobacteria bacterium]|nr:flagellin [Gammaproteobacteria bacterium]
SMLQTVEGASKEITNMLVRMKELAVQSRSDTYSLADRDALDLEFQALKTEITRVQANTEWNGMKLMDSDKGTLKIQLGSSSMDVVTKDWSFAAAATADHVFQSATNAATFAITDNAAANRTQSAAATNAGNAITLIDTMINEATKEQATLGAYISRLTHAADNLANVSANTDQSRSRIQDADYAVETTNLARTQIIAQASTAMLAQANQSKQSVLALLR